MLLIALIIPCISFFLQAYPRFFNKYFGVDVWSRMMEADLIRKNHHKIPKNKIRKQFIIDGYFNYPPALPFLLSFISRKKLVALQGFIAPLFDVTLNLFIFIWVYYLFGRIDMAVVAQIVYASIPLLILENSYLTPRSLGYLSFSMSFLGQLLYSIDPQPIFLVAAIVFSLLLFLSHKFATQSMLFISIFFTILDQSPLYLTTFSIGFIFATILTGGYYLRVLHGHIANIRYWTKHYEYRFAHQIRGNKPVLKKRDVVEKINALLGSFTPITIVGTNIWIISAAVYLYSLFTEFPLSENILITKLCIWIIFFYCFSVIVLSWKKMVPIGEGQRYLEMTGLPTAIVSSFIFFELLESPYSVFSGVIFGSILVLNIALTISIQMIGIIRDKNRSLTNDMEKVIRFVNGYSAPRILCIPHQITTMVLFNSKADVLVDIEAGTLGRIEDVFPVLQKNIKQIGKKYNLNLLITRKQYVTMEELNLSKKDLLLDTEDTQVFKLT